LHAYADQDLVVLLGPSSEPVRAVLTSAVHYADPAQYRPTDVLDAARLLRPVE
jgi:hypothetical protein